VKRNRKAGQNPPRVVAPMEEEEEELYSPGDTRRATCRNVVYGLY